MTTQELVKEIMEKVNELHAMQPDLDYSVKGKQAVEDALYRYFNECRAKHLHRAAINGRAANE